MPTTSTYRLALSLVCAAWLSCAASSASATPITKQLDVSVYQLCNTLGDCASTGPAGNAYYADATNKIWAQAGIRVTFNFVKAIVSDQFYDIGDTAGDTFDDLYNSVFPGMAGLNHSTVDMFLVNSYAGAYGVGYDSAGGLIMSMSDIQSFDCNGAAGCTGRIDTLAHEIGHNLGLVPENFPDYAGAEDPGHSLDPSTLMASGGVRNVPTTLADIRPDGLGYGWLPQHHIDHALQSTLLRDVSPIPEPSTYLLMGLGLAALTGIRRRH
ncbi:PEP-CTERM sorting domain-containing protein [Aquincola sp. MAHUQ-54]|uniref:PEP-CTERM sorting domain-containing protein n=1 Tax=Aquincola agrisoli TaxID=3119538 RepID=A0AAW9QIL6_9BURK